MNTLLREKQLKYVDVEEMRVVTNDRHIGEQIKSDSTLCAQGNPLHDKDENIVINESKVGEFGKVKKEQHLKNTVTNGVESERGELVKSVAMNGVKKWKNFEN